MLFQVVQPALMLVNYKKVDKVQYKYLWTLERATLSRRELPGSKHLRKDQIGGVRADTKGQFSKAHDSSLEACQIWGHRSFLVQLAPWVMLATWDGHFKIPKDRDLSKGLAVPFSHGKWCLWMSHCYAI